MTACHMIISKIPTAYVSVTQPRILVIMRVGLSWKAVNVWFAGILGLWCRMHIRWTSGGWEQQNDDESLDSLPFFALHISDSFLGHLSYQSHQEQAFPRSSFIFMHQTAEMKHKVGIKSRLKWLQDGIGALWQLFSIGWILPRVLFTP